MRIKGSMKFWMVPIGSILVAASWIAASSFRGEEVATAVDGSAGRASLQVCVEVSPDLRPTLSDEQARSLVSSAMDRLSAGSQWRDAGLDQYPRSVDSDCPLGYLDPPPNVGGNWGQLVGGTEAVTVPSQYSTMVYIVGPEARAELGTRGFGRAAREMTCEGHVCGEVTTALFVSVDLASDLPKFDQAMRFGMGIDDASDATYPSGHRPEDDGITK